MRVFILALSILFLNEARAKECTVGVASWYGEPFHGRITKSGEVYDMNKYTAAHNSLPMGTLVKVTNLENNKSVVVKINDTGSFGKKYKRIIDLSRQAAKIVGYLDNGLANVQVCIIN